jgi:hypothetical protein
MEWVALFKEFIELGTGVARKVHSYRVTGDGDLVSFDVYSNL